MQKKYQTYVEGALIKENPNGAPSKMVFLTHNVHSIAQGSKWNIKGKKCYRIDTFGRRVK